jgi:adenylate kinase
VSVQNNAVCCRRPPVSLPLPINVTTAWSTPIQPFSARALPGFLNIPGAWFPNVPAFLESKPLADLRTCGEPFPRPLIYCPLITAYSPALSPFYSTPFTFQLLSLFPRPSQCISSPPSLPGSSRSFQADKVVNDAISNRIFTFRFLDMERVQSLSRAVRLLLIGAPGVGKGTQTDRMLKRYTQLSAISSGDLLRDNVRNRTPLGMTHGCSFRATAILTPSLGISAESLMKSGALVPDNMMLRLILNELNKRGWIKSDTVMPYTLNSTSLLSESSSSSRYMDDVIVGAPMSQGYTYSEDPHASFILDGFPRNASQAKQVDNLIPINFVVHINTPAKVVMDRIANRWVHGPSGRVYNLTFNPPKVEGKDDVTGEALTRRDDDDPEVWKERLSRFEKTSMPLLEHYDNKGVLWTVDGNSSDEISPKLFKEFERRFAIE